MKTTLARMALILAPSLFGCTAEQAYYATQGWQRNQCAKLPDKSEFDHCMRKADTSYDAYRHQRESGQR